MPTRPERDETGLVSRPTPPDQRRALTQRERQALLAILDRGTSSRDDHPLESSDRARWRAQVPFTRAGRRCGCGQCPSIELTDSQGLTPADGDGRVVLDAWTPGALLMLFVDQDQLSYLELAPMDHDDAMLEFPDPDDIHPI